METPLGLSHLDVARRWQFILDQNNLNEAEMLTAFRKKFELGSDPGHLTTIRSVRNEPGYARQFIRKTALAYAVRLSQDEPLEAATKYINQNLALKLEPEHVHEERLRERNRQRVKLRKQKLNAAKRDGVPKSPPPPQELLSQVFNAICVAVNNPKVREVAFTVKNGLPHLRVRQEV